MEKNAMLKENVEKVRRILEEESRPFGRVPELIAVTKFATPEMILPLYDLGVKNIGENSCEIGSSTDRIGFVICQGDAAEEAVSICEKVLETVKIVIE